MENVGSVLTQSLLTFMIQGAGKAQGRCRLRSLVAYLGIDVVDE